MVGGKDDGLALPFFVVPNTHLCRARHAIPPINLEPVAMPRLNHARRRRGDIGLAEAVRVIRGAEYLRESPALIEVGGEWTKFG